MARPRILLVNMASVMIAALSRHEHAGDVVTVTARQMDHYPLVSNLTGVSDDRVPRRKGEKRRNRANRWR